MQTSPDTQIEHYLRTGEYDQDFPAWPGGNFFDRSRHGHAALREALIEAVLQRTSGARMSESLIDKDVTALARTKALRNVGRRKEPIS